MLTPHAEAPAPVRVSRLMRRVPFFYGWVVLGAAAFGLVMTSPGQTYTISIFIESYIRDLGISRSLVSTYYLIGTLTASLALPYVGRLLDRFGPRAMAVAIALAFGLACWYMSAVQTGLMLLFGFVLVRLLGQGSLGMISTYFVNQWWVRRRGTINGVSGVVMALMGVGAFPNLVNWLIPQVGWRTAWVVLGVALIVLMVPVAYLFYRARPEQFGLLPDGAKQTAEKDTTPVAAEDNWTVSEATHTSAFWIVCLGMASFAMLSTGLTFHNVSIFADRGLSASAAAAVFVPLAMTTAAVNLVSGVLVDRTPVKALLVFALILQTAALWMAPTLTGVMSALLYGITLGALMGLTRTITSVVWVAYFGRLHLGSITGIASTVMVAGSALGPLPMGMARDMLGEYGLALRLLSLIPLVLAVVTLFMRAPTRRQESGG